MVTPASVQRKIRLLGMSEYRRHPASPNQTGPSTQSKPSAMRLTGALPKTYRLNAGSITSKNDLSLVPINVIVYRGRISNQERHQKSARRRLTSVLHGRLTKPAYRRRAHARRGPQG